VEAKPTPKKAMVTISADSLKKLLAAQKQKNVEPKPQKKMSMQEALDQMRARAEKLKDRRKQKYTVTDSMHPGTFLIFDMMDVAGNSDNTGEMDPVITTRVGLEWKQYWGKWRTDLYSALSFPAIGLDHVDSSFHSFFRGSVHYPISHKTSKSSSEVAVGGRRISYNMVAIDYFNVPTPSHAYWNVHAGAESGLLERMAFFGIDYTLTEGVTILFDDEEYSNFSYFDWGVETLYAWEYSNWVLRNYHKEGKDPARFGGRTYLSYKFNGVSGTRFFMMKFGGGWLRAPFWSMDMSINLGI
jgi:hypothetical protein